MTTNAETSADALRMRDAFARELAESALFREDRAIAEKIAEHAGPILDALATAPEAEDAALHDAFAWIAGASRRAAELGATPGTILRLPRAIAAALGDRAKRFTPRGWDAMITVAAEAYCVAREEHVGRELRQRAAEAQVSLPIAEGCVVVALVGRHAEEQLEPVLDRFARDMLRDRTQSCVIDATRLDVPEPEALRGLGRLCAQLTMLGIRVAVVSGDRDLAEKFRSWSLDPERVGVFDRYSAAQTAALGWAGFAVRPAPLWRRFLPGMSRWMRTESTG